MSARTSLWLTTAPRALTGIVQIGGHVSQCWRGPRRLEEREDCSIGLRRPSEIDCPSLVTENNPFVKVPFDGTLEVIVQVKTGVFASIGGTPRWIDLKLECGRRGFDTGGLESLLAVSRANRS